MSGQHSYPHHSTRAGCVKQSMCQQGVPMTLAGVRRPRTNRRKGTYCLPSIHQFELPHSTKYHYLRNTMASVLSVTSNLSQPYGDSGHMDFGSISNGKFGGIFERVGSQFSTRCMGQCVFCVSRKYENLPQNRCTGVILPRGLAWNLDGSLCCPRMTVFELVLRSLCLYVPSLPFELSALNFSQFVIT